MDKYLENHKLPKPMQDETGSLNNPITTKDSELIVKTSFKSLGSDNFTCEFCQTRKGEKTTNSTQSLPKK